MLRHSRLTFVSILLLLALIVPTNVVQAAQATPQAPTDISVAPSANLAVPDEVAQVVKLRESLTAEQISKIQAVVESHKAELQEISNALPALEAASSNLENKVFLPAISASGNVQSQAKAAAPSAITPEKAGQLRQIMQRMLAVQDKINQEVESVLTTSQREVYAKQAAKLKSTGQAMAAKLQAATAQSPEGAESSTDCFYGAYYGAYGNWYAYWGYYYSYLNYYTYFTSNGYYAYLYAYYSYYYYTGYGLHDAAGAYFDAAYGFGYDSNSWSDSATSYLYGGYYYSFYSKYYALLDYNNTGHTYAYYAYYYEYYATYYEYAAYGYETSC